MNSVVPIQSAYINNTAFSNRLPALQLYWDSTSLGTLIECPRKYFYSILWGWTPRDASVHLVFGILYHEALERYDRLKAIGLDHRQATITVVRQTMIKTWNKEKNRPWTSDHKTKNRLTLIRTIVWYLDKYENDPLKTIILSNGAPAVELSWRFRTEYSGPTGESYHLCGHLDRLASFNEELWIADHKTTSYGIDQNFFAKFTPDHQMSTYDFAGKVVYNQPTQGIIVSAAQVLVTLSHHERGLVHRTEAMRKEWYQETVRYHLAMAGQYAEMNLWPRNEKACGHYGGCPFRPICSHSPEVREKWLTSTYVQRMWDPLQVRGDI